MKKEKLVEPPDKINKSGVNIKLINLLEKYIRHINKIM